MIKSRKKIEETLFIELNRMRSLFDAISLMVENVGDAWERDAIRTVCMCGNEQLKIVMPLVALIALEGEPKVEKDEVVAFTSSKRKTASVN